MKRAASIFFLSLSALLILIMPFVPHHHHDDVECMVMERCDSDNTYNDEHTAHHQDHDTKDHPLCVKNLLTLKAKSQVQEDVISVHLLPLLLWGDETLLSAIRPEGEMLCDGYQMGYVPLVGSRIQSLRAPPYFQFRF